MIDNTWQVQLRDDSRFAKAQGHTNQKRQGLFVGGDERNP